ncbi:unnamed protein product [Candidula unifasciata]|uniref:Kinesin motor domain-containing protein n=1 Tax=Candidula unifasciata TaxID=100452 RepID=A0A8S4A3U7_9EUPU|nr:unnamed protein product [Candidula unifasciata]
MPLGMDTSKFYANKSKELEVQLQRKNERIVSLETENAMLYLKLAQLRGDVRSARQEAMLSSAELEDSEQFKEEVVQKTVVIHQDTKALRLELDRLKAFVIEMSVSFQLYLQRAKAAVHSNRASYHSHSSIVTALQDQLVQLQQALHDVSERHAKEKRRRQELHNILMELRGNIRVHSRLRPLMEFDGENEDSSGLGRPGTRSEVVVHYVDDENICVRTNKNTKVFEYERVFGPTEKQESVFDEVRPMLQSLLDGYNICIMAYGQTGSGKTHTMLGSHHNEEYHLSHDAHPDEGVIPRATRELFRLIEEKPLGTHSVEVSVVEVYNNDIRDLLSRDTNAKHDIITGSDGQLSIPTVTSKQVDCIDGVMNLVQFGLKTRRESATLIHEHSSRSHLIVTLTVTSAAPSFFGKSVSLESNLCEVGLSGTGMSTKKGNPQPQIWTTDQGPGKPLAATGAPWPNQQPLVKTKLQLVDLAGSECVGMSGVRGAALREASYINKSLSALADVLGALAEHRTHVPYRNSRLTHFLQDSIGGDAKLLILLCVSPAQRYITESLQCLGFGQRARQVQRGQTKKRLPSSAEKVASDTSSGTRPRSGSSSR